MVAKASIIKNYAKADAAEKVDIICKNYSNFIGIVDGYTEGLCYMIENEKVYNRKQSRGDLGVRVQTSGMHSDITADTAISNVMTSGNELRIFKGYLSGKKDIGDIAEEEGIMSPQHRR